MNEALKEGSKERFGTIIHPMPPITVQSCSSSEVKDKEGAKAVAANLADWLANSAKKYGVDAGHLTLCVSIFATSDRENIGIVITHSSSYTYSGDQVQSSMLHYQSGMIGLKDDYVVWAKEEHSGLLKLVSAFIYSNLTALVEALDKAGLYWSDKSYILLPENHPLVYYDRETNLHFLLEPDQLLEASESQLEKAEKDAQKRAVNFAQRHRCKVVDTEGKIATYDLDNYNYHHAEMRAIQWGNRLKLELVAMAPTKGCCTSTQRELNCQKYLTDKGLIDCVPKGRRDQNHFDAKQI